MSEGEKECLVVIVGLFRPAQLNTFFCGAHAYFELKTKVMRIFNDYFKVLK